MNEPRPSSPTGVGASLDRVALRAIPVYALNSAGATLRAVLFARWMAGDAFGGLVAAFYVCRLIALVAGLGLPAGAVRFLSRYRHEGRDRLYRGFLSVGLSVEVLAGLLLGGSIAMLASASRSHTEAALAEAWWLVPLLGLNAFLGNVDKSAGRVRTSALEQGALRHALSVLIGWVMLVQLGQLTGADAIRAVGVSAALVVAVQAIGRWRQGDRLAPRRFDLGPWLRVSGSMALLWGVRLLGASGAVLILRMVVGETEAGAFHLATEWAAWAAIPGLAYAGAAGRLVAREKGASARRLASFALRRAIVPTAVLAAAVAPVAGYWLDRPDATHRLAEQLLLPLLIAWALHGIENLAFSGLSLSDRESQATVLAVGLTLISLGVTAVLAFVGPVAVAWGTLATRLVSVLILAFLGIKGCRKSRAETPDSRVRPR